MKAASGGVRPRDRNQAGGSSQRVSIRSRARKRAARRAAQLAGQDAVTAAVTEALAPVAEGIRGQDKAPKVQAGTLTKIAKQG